MDLSWSQLPSEILDLVLQRLDLPDCFSFHKVCSSWRSVFLDRRRLTRPPPCLILIPYSYRRDIILLHNLHGGQLLKLHSPLLNLNQGEQIVGSSMGWWAIVSYKKVFITWRKSASCIPSLHLLNPISNERIPLPSLQTSTIYNVVLSSAPTSRDCVLVLSTLVNDYASSVSCAWCRLGDSQWTFFKVRHDHDPFFCVVDMVFHRGKLYILGEEGKYNVYAFEPQPRMTGNGTVPNISKISRGYKQQMVHSGGALLFVGQRRGQPEVWDLLKLVEEMDRWERLESLGDRALLISHTTMVGHSSSLESFCTQELMGSGFESNCIYFWEFLSRELVKFSLTERSCQRIDIPHFEENAHFVVEWIVPQAWNRTNPGTLANDNFPPMPSFWLPPPDDTLKVNLDAGFLDGVATYGIVIRNHLGHVVICKYGSCSAPDPFHAKGLALLHGMELAALRNFSRVMFECDDEMLVTLLKYDEAQPPRDACEIIKSCKMLAAAKFDECSFCYIRWEGNTAAHGLTLLAQNNQSPNADMGVTSLVAPDAISEVISAELANMSRTNPGTLANDNFPPMPSFWLPPPEDTFKVNLDAGFLDGVATYGIVIRNHLGHVVICKYGSCSAPDPFHAKGLALQHGMELAALHNFSRVMFECDDERLVTLLKYDEAQPPRNACEIIKSCKKLAAAKFDECSFCYIRWEGNTAAHGLTLLAQNNQSPNSDMGVTSLVAPNAISEVISAELANM